tara:strand:- start:275 stop:511 length:237 start_codon:yes stop_codon:yes gene_type:complete
VEKGDSVNNYDTGLYLEQKGSQSIDLMGFNPVTKAAEIVRLGGCPIYCFAYPYSQSQNSQLTGAVLERENSGFSAIKK